MGKKWKWRENGAGDDGKSNLFNPLFVRSIPALLFAKEASVEDRGMLYDSLQAIRKYIL